MSESLSESRRYHVTTFGCQMNKADSERMAGILEEITFNVTNAAEIPANSNLDLISNFFYKLIFNSVDQFNLIGFKFLVCLVGIFSEISITYDVTSAYRILGRLSIVKIKNNY